MKRPQRDSGKTHQTAKAIDGGAINQVVGDQHNYYGESGSAPRVPAALPDGAVHELQIRLDAARQGQIKAQETVLGLTRLTYIFMSTMTVLKQRCTNLQAERDQARLLLRQQEAAAATTNQQRMIQNQQRAAETERRLAETERRLAEAEQQCAEVEHRLTRARRKRHEAEDLRIEALQQAEQQRRAYEQQTGREDTYIGPSGGNGDSTALPPPSGEHDHFIEDADEQLDSYEARLDSIREQIGVPAPPAPDGARIIPGEPLVDPSANSTDRTGNVSAPEKGGPSLPGDGNATGGNLQDRKDGPPSRGPGPRHALPHKRRRLTLVGTAWLALPAALLGGGWLTWDQFYSEYTLSDSPSLKNAKQITIGLKEDQPGLSVYDKATKKYTGFEASLAEFIAAELGFKGKKVKFKKVTTEDRKPKLATEEVNLVVATYSSFSDGKERNIKGVIFAGPYFNTGQGMLMRKGGADGEVKVRDSKGTITSKKVNGFSDLPAGARVCTARESTSESILNQKYKGKLEITPLSTYEGCMNGLHNIDDKYDAVSTDKVILAGFAARNPDKLIVQDTTIAPERYGVGVREDDPALRYLTCRAIEKAIETGSWDKWYDSNLKEILGGEEPGPGRPDPKLECHGK
ncbi:transporter substrate-binding domain-containing protein [Actinomadura coerulea]|uniref:transporter substrate-binding domain-containing protein n=1 Tax=Actinomadura coerulea TaxID=46159 RepID=UPI00343BFADD